MRVLLIDDNPNDRLIVTRELKQAFSDVEVNSAMDAQSLDAALTAGDFDVVITDYQLRWTDGLQVLATIKTRYPNCPVIMFTDSGSEEVAVAGMKAGLSDYVLKGRSIHRLSVAVRESLSKQKLQQDYATALEQLRESEESLRFALDAARIVAYRWDIRTGEVRRSVNAGKVTGLGQEAVYGTFEECLKLIHPDDQERFLASVQAAITNQARHNIEFRSVLPDGSIIWIHDQARVTYDETGNAVQMFGMGMDITARKQAQTRERSHQQRLKQLADAALVINSTLSLDEIIQLITTSAREIIGAHQAVINLAVDGDWEKGIMKVSLSDKYAQWRDYNEAPDGSGIYKLVCQTQRPQRLTQTELEAHPAWRGFGKAAGKHPPMRGWLAVPLTSRSGKNLGIIQLSDRYEGEFTEEDENILVQLAQMAASAIDNAHLYGESQQANRLKDEFLAVLSHELRTPLNAILGWSNMLRSRNLDSTTIALALETIERNARLQTQLIEDLLDISRIMRGKLSLNVSAINLCQPINAAIDTVRFTAQSKSIQIHTDLDDTIGLVSGDSSRLQQVFWNLLANAIKFTPSGGKVEVKLERICEQNKPYAQVTISDTGKGISPDFLPYVFDYFRQADASLTRQHGGLGLGLAIVRRLVELHGGTVGANSPGEGQGATFTVKLPMLSAPAVPLSPLSFPASPSSVPLAGIRVLVVDDDRDCCQMIVFILEHFGAQAQAVNSAVEALSTLEGFQPDVLISDIGMPEQDGYMLLQQVRSRKGKRIYAIALTAYARPEDRQQALQAGFDCHLGKPIEADELIAAILNFNQNSG